MNKKLINVSSSYKTIEQPQQLTIDQQKEFESMGWKQIQYDYKDGVYIYTFKKKIQY